MRSATPVSTDAAPRPGGTYSQAVVAGPFVYLAGQGPFDPVTQELVGPGDVAAQVRQTLENLEAVAQAAGASLADAVRIGVFLQDLGDFPTLNEVFPEYLSQPYPARTTVQAGLAGFLVEIDAVLYKP